ncbi:hypothetical protein SAMN02745866_01536 [Alteromonadaceae bacterium Bs31]|nr:hypothetical protein SAMN02745866_01536 [Alteromonadaceae bacterium Bs31]
MYKTKAIKRLSLLLTISLFSVHALAQHVYYRYLNEEGVKVLGQSIPPEYAQAGYEVLNASGQVIKVVPPAPSDEDIARNAAEREIQQIYARLKRRYSAAEDIEDAKHRRLKNIDTNIAILNGNISGLKREINKQMSKAADFERRGVNIPKQLLDKLDNTRAELAVAEEILAIREKEYQEVIAKYDQDKALFEKGRALEKNTRAKFE